MEPQRLIPGDSTLVENIVNYLKAKGIFDEFRHECLADVDTKSSCQNLSQRVDGYASKFLANETWHPDLNKNELRNKLRRHIDESGMLAVGADHVVEQVINPKIHQLFLPKIIEVVHQYMKEQNEMLSKKPQTSPVDNALSENASDTIDLNKTKTSISDPIADILSFSYSKTKPLPVSTAHGKTDSISQKHIDILKVEKKKEEKNSSVIEKNVFDPPCESHPNPVIADVKSQTDKEKEKNKKDEPEVPLEAPKKAVKEETKLEKKRSEEVKPQISEINTSVEENKASTSLPTKPNISSKKDVDKNKQKSKSASIPRSSSISSDVKKSKKESSDKSSEKHIKSKLSKTRKESPSPTKSVSSVKSVTKDEKVGETSKSKSSDSSSNRTSESSQKKSSKSNNNKLDPSSSKQKTEKSEKYKISKSSDKNEQSFHHEPANTEKGMKILYSSSYESSQGSDQEKSSSSSSKKERQKYFSKHTKKESSEKHSDKSSRVLSYKRRSKDATDESPTKKHKSEKNTVHEKMKETITVGEAAKISSRSNSFGSTSSVSSSSNTSKDNLVSNSDEALENTKKDKKKKQIKEKEPCHSLKTLPPPPPPPPPSSSLSCELTSSAEVSSIEDTQSSSNSENSSSEELTEQSSSDSEVESKESILNTLNESMLNSSTDDINDFYDIFLYSSSSSEFEGYGDSPDKRRTESVLEKINESDISVSSVHTSDLSSYDDELSDDDYFFGDESHPGVKKRLTLKQAQELIQKRKEFLLSLDEDKSIPVTNKAEEDCITFNKGATERSSLLLSSEDECFPSEPKRSLRRERKLNPRYASSEYTSIFNSRKETFITKQSSPYAKIQTTNSSPVNEMKYRKESAVEKEKPLKKNSVETRIVKIHQSNVEQSHKTKRKVYKSENLEEDKELSDSSHISSSDEMDSIDKEKLFSENDDSNNVSGTDQLKLQFKFKPQSISNCTISSYPVKRKLKDSESSPAKRPCSRGSVDSSSSECVPNENKPFNSEKLDLLDEKTIRDGDFKVSDLTDAIKRDLFCKQRTNNNNGDILGQKDIFPKHSRGKALSTPEKKTSENENSKELSAL